MKTKILNVSALALLLSSSSFIHSQVQAASMMFQQEEKEADNQEAPTEEAKKDNHPKLTINGIGQSASFTVSPRDLNADQPIQLIAPVGFSVSPATIPADAQPTRVTVTLNSSKHQSTGKLLLRSGDTRSYVTLLGFAGELARKELVQSPIYKGGQDEKFVKTAADGFKPGDKGYTVEFKVNTSEDGQGFYPYFVNEKGIGVKGYVDAAGMGFYSGTSKKDISNPATQVDGGQGKFYNADGRSHTYRYAVAPDNRIFIFRDGIAVDTVRAQDYGTQTDFATESGDPVENLLKNPGFEGEFETAYDNNMVTAIEGWDIIIGDRYNSEQFIVSQEIDNDQDFNNHVLQMNRYKWADGWGAAEIVQVVDVAPNESYTLEALVKGGFKENEGIYLGKIKIQEVQDNAAGTSTDISSDTWETYSLDYTTSANCKQIRVIFYLERDKRGADITSLEIDNVKLTGRSRTYTPKVGFENLGAEVDYFTYDLSGAYAPAKMPAIQIELGKK